MLGAFPGLVEVLLELVERLEVSEVVEPDDVVDLDDVLVLDDALELDEVVVPGGLPALAPKSKRMTAFWLCALLLSLSVTVIS